MSDRHRWIVQEEFWDMDMPNNWQYSWLGRADTITLREFRQLSKLHRLYRDAGV